jgi:signal transduction histidine kinase
VLFAIAGALLAVRAGWNWQQSWVPPVLLAFTGLAIAWTNASTSPSKTNNDLPRRRPVWLRLIGGFLLVVTGLLVFSGQRTDVHELVSILTAMLIVLLGVALVLAPWWVRLGRAASGERSARIREAERADIAAHLHDSVLQTLALIKANANDAEAVARLARTQERELREWLYADRPVADTSLATQMRALVAQVEDGSISKTGVPPTAIEVIIVGDCPPDADAAALLAATREALVNAVTHGKPPVSVYLEVDDAQIEVSVRDRGNGFVLAEVNPDRLGVRNSILARMERRGGQAEVISRPNWGTEIRLKLPRS